MRGGLCALVVVLAGCLESPAVECAGGLLCPPGFVCDQVGGGCAQPEQLSECDGEADQTRCAYPGVEDGRCYDGVCRPAGCGNLQPDPMEVCDDGNRLHGDGCSADCRSNEKCGNGFVDVTKGEACDDGRQCSDGTDCADDDDCVGIGDGSCATRSEDGCQANCTLPTCGDGFVDSSLNEQCDAGDDNSNAPDALCRPTCQRPRCGDEVTDPGLGEVCDDGDLISGNGCSFDCRSDETCGNGYPDFLRGEECDDGDAVRHDGCDACAAERPSWTVPVRLPEPRTGAMAYDTVRDRLVMFGGGIDGDQLGDTWEYTGARWVELTPEVAPPARLGHAMAFDEARGELVLFGGQGVNGLVDDTWLWDGASWRQVPRATPWPTPRFYHAMGYDPISQRVILHGGVFGADGLDETWAWDGTAWSLLSPATTPGPRAVHAMTLDRRRGRLVMFGGTAATPPTADVVEWSGTNWVVVPSGSPAPALRTYHEMAWDPVQQVVMVVGGTDLASHFDDAWAWNGTGWTDVTPASNLLSPRSRPALAADSDRLLLFGGIDFDLTSGAVVELFGDTLAWTGTTWVDAAPSTAVPNPSGLELTYDPLRGRVLGLSSSELWQRRDGIWSKLNDFPGNGTVDAITFDSARDRLVAITSKADVWEWSPTAGWVQPARTGNWPKDRTHPAMVYDPAREVTLLFGGAGLADTLADTWLWNGSAWSQLAPAAVPPARWGAGIAFDDGRGRAVLFGGTGKGGALADTWEWDGTTWIDATPAQSPQARWQPAMVYDALRARVILFSGGSATVVADTWEWDGTSWTALDPDEVPPAREDAGVAYDAVEQLVVMRGPGDGVDTWTFQYRGDGVDDLCVAAADRDRDGLAGCADPNCWGFCDGCGDGSCNPDLESCALCPADCCP